MVERLFADLLSVAPSLWNYVIVHELAHLVEFNHSPAFNALVEKYPLAERARGFLIAKSSGEEDTPSPIGDDDGHEAVDMLDEDRTEPSHGTVAATFD